MQQLLVGRLHSGYGTFVDVNTEVVGRGGDGESKPVAGRRDGMVMVEDILEAPSRQC